MNENEKKNEKNEGDNEEQLIKKGICPNCKSNLIIFQEGCMTCLQCGWGKCDG